MRRLLEHAFELHLGTSTRSGRGFPYPRASAEDAWQEACLAALLHPERVDEFDSWLAEAARRAASHALHGERDRHEREKRTADAEAQPSTIDVVVGRELLRELNTAVAGLHESYRATIRMRFFEDLCPRVIASRTGLPVNTVKAHLRRGLERVRHILTASVQPEAGPPPDGGCWRGSLPPGRTGWRELARADRAPAAGMTLASVEFPDPESRSFPQPPKESPDSLHPIRERLGLKQLGSG